MKARWWVASFIGLALLLAAGTRRESPAQTNANRSTAADAVRSFYAFHLAHGKDFTVRNVQQRKLWLAPELFALLLKELNRQADYSKAHPDEAPDFEGDPFTDAQEYPDSFRVGAVITNGDRAKATVTLNWSARTGRGVDTRNITVDLARSGGVWLINDFISSDGSSLRDELNKER